VSGRCGIINDAQRDEPLSMIFYAAAGDGSDGDVPRRAPQAVTGRAVNSTALVVSWQPPAITSPWVTSYRVILSPARLDPTADEEVAVSPPVETIVPADDGSDAARTTVVVGGLDKFTPYTIAVAAFSARGDGPFSDAIVVQTDEDGRGTGVTASPAHFLCAECYPNPRMCLGL